MYTKTVYAKGFENDLVSQHFTLLANSIQYQIPIKTSFSDLDSEENVFTKANPSYVKSYYVIFFP